MFVFPSNPKLNQSPPQDNKNNPEKTALGKRAVAKLVEANSLIIDGQNDPAWNACGETINLSKLDGNRSGQADALAMLGTLESKLGHGEQARDHYNERARIASLAQGSERSSAVKRPSYRLTDKPADFVQRYFRRGGRMAWYDPKLTYMPAGVAH